MAVKRWNIREYSEQAVSELAMETGFPRLVCSVLASRGINTAEKTAAFLGGNEVFHNPYMMKDMEKAVDRIRMAVENQEPIVIYGDYDCDGITATALLCSYLAEVGADVSYYIPKRDGEGYGLNTKAVSALAKRGIKLIITVDNGISSLEEAELAKSLGVDLIITDHHTPRETVPNAVAVLNPHRKDCEYPFKELSGVGVAFKLVCALEDDIDCEDTLYQYGAITALGTVADVVELKGENRVIVQNGLQGMEDCPYLGINALIKAAGYEGKPLDSTALAFGLAPRINAAGRLEQTNKAVELLLAEDEEEAEILANEINELNALRRKTEQEITDDITNIILNNPKLLNERVIIISGENWNAGVIGIICAKIVEKYGKPCILISNCDGEARASARSVEGYSIIAAISRCSRLLKRFGGHVMAAGFSLDSADVSEFCSELLADAKQHFPIMPVHCINIDCVVEPDLLTVENVSKLEMLQPYGAGNEQPVFAVLGAVLEGINPIGDGKHLRLYFVKDEKRFQALYFGMRAENFLYQIGDKLDIAADVSLNSYNKSVSVTVKIKDMRLSGVNYDNYFIHSQIYERYCIGEAEDVSLLVPTREEMGRVYRFIRSNAAICTSNEVIYCRLRDMEYGKLRIIMDIMQELELIEIASSNGRQTIKVIPKTEKVNLESSQLLQELRRKCLQ
ncbi:MAG: single-stranded-DNA-specific exonuclease RecJ [Oscillospiraceae bacterium]|nr:single-stranded-DNA-specific exonuclease RecJ [Oscillospiraceae bacterium]